MAPCRNKSRATSVVAKEAALSAKKVDAFVTVLDSLFLQNSLSLSKYEIEKSSLKMGILCKTLVSPPIPISGYFSYIRTLFQNVFFSSTHQPDEDERGPMKRREREKEEEKSRNERQWRWIQASFTHQATATSWTGTRCTSTRCSTRRRPPSLSRSTDTKEATKVEEGKASTRMTCSLALALVPDRSQALAPLRLALLRYKEGESRALTICGKTPTPSPCARKAIHHRRDQSLFYFQDQNQFGKDPLTFYFSSSSVSGFLIVQTTSSG